MLTINKRFPLGKGMVVGSLALAAGFLSSVTVLNLLDGAQTSEPIAQVSTSEDRGEVLGASTTSKNNTTESEDDAGLRWDRPSYGSVDSADTSESTASDSDATPTPTPSQPATPVTPPVSSPSTGETPTPDDCACETGESLTEPVETLLNSTTETVRGVVGPIIP